MSENEQTELIYIKTNYMQTFKDRVRQVFSMSGKSRKELTIMLGGVSEMTQRRWEQGKSAMSYDQILNILQAFPEINVEWFILGKGHMYYHDPANLKESEVGYGNKVDAHFSARIQDLKAALEHAYEEIEHLRFINREILKAIKK